jgi:hypothetical protein
MEFLAVGIPFLPPGKGGLILILGGLTMLALALLLLTVRPGRIPGGSRLASGPVGQTMALDLGAAQAPALAEPEPWHRSLCVQASRRGAHRVNLLHTSPDSCIVVVESCSCVRRGRCSAERRAITTSARQIRRHARVREICCRVGGTARCAFEVSLKK